MRRLRQSDEEGTKNEDINAICEGNIIRDTDIRERKETVRQTRRAGAKDAHFQRNEARLSVRSMK